MGCLKGGEKRCVVECVVGKLCVVAWGRRGGLLLRRRLG